MPRRGDDVDRRVAKRDLRAFGSDDDVALGHAARSRGGTRERRFPICRAHHDLCAIPALEQRGALIVITVRVADQHVLDLARIETERRQPLDNLRLDGVIEQRVDEDDAVGRRERPGGVNLRTDEVEVVKHLDRFGIPPGSLGWPLLPLPAGALSAALAATLPAILATGRSRRSALAGSSRARAEALEVE